LEGLEERQVPTTFTTIHVPGSTYTTATGINDSGQIVGFYYVGSSNTTHSFLLSGGIYTTIDVPGSTYTQAYGINDSGQVVGSYGVGMGGLPRGFLLSGGSYTTLHVPGALQDYPRGINDSGQVVGYYVTFPSGYHGFLLSGGSYTTFDYPGADDTTPYGINASGQIVGDYDVGGGDPQSFLLSGGSYAPIDVPGSVYTRALGINDSGQVVGEYYDGNSFPGFLLTGGSYTTIDVPGSNGTTPYGINDFGLIVGQYFGDGYGFLTSPVTTVTWTNPAGGLWGVASNWSDGRVPGPGDGVDIGPLDPGAVVTHGSGADTVGSLTSHGDLVVSGGSSLTVLGTYLQSAGSIELAGGTLGVGLLDLQGGVFGGSGTLNGNVRNAAVVSPGTATASGVLTINGQYTQTVTGTLRLDIGGPQAGTDYSQMVVNGLATLDGTLEINLVNGYQPRFGDLFQVLTFSRGAGTFAYFVADGAPFGPLYAYEEGPWGPPGLYLVAGG
jgi:hypothetical protein